MSTELILRIVFAVIFATLAVIFSELIPPLAGVNTIVLRIVVTLLSGLVGFYVFSDIAKRVTLLSISMFNFVVHRLSTEIMSQILRLPKASSPFSFGNPTPQIGGITLQKPFILDTSSIIDGRVLDICKTGFMSGLVLIPNFVLLELQQVADSADALKRARGRRGFEIISELKKVKGIKVEIWDKEGVGKSVDEKLLRLSKSLQGKILTVDFNLNKLSVAHGVTVLNVNDLTNAVKTVTIPGESMVIKVIHVGKNPKQGVGYLPDGTMIVIEDGANFIGQDIKVEVLKILQGSSGRMIFAKT